MQQGIDAGEVQPLPLTVFSRSKAEDAFRHMATGTHIGKCMIQMSEDSQEASSLNCIGPKQQITPALTIAPEAMEDANVAAICPRPTFTCRQASKAAFKSGKGHYLVHLKA